VLPSGLVGRAPGNTGALVLDILRGGTDCGGVGSTLHLALHKIPMPNLDPQAGEADQQRDCHRAYDGYSTLSACTEIHGLTNVYVFDGIDHADRDRCTDYHEQCRKDEHHHWYRQQHRQTCSTFFHECLTVGAHFHSDHAQ
jgi:hypothetical protein